MITNQPSTSCDPNQRFDLYHDNDVCYVINTHTISKKYQNKGTLPLPNQQSKSQTNLKSE